MNIGLSVGHHAVRHPKRRAVDDNGERSLTYAELEERSNRVANLLHGLGVERGDRVAYVVLNRLEVCEMLVGIAKAGAIAAPVNPRLSEKDKGAIIENAQPRVIFTEAEFRDLIDGLAKEVDAVVVDLSDGYEDDLASASPVRPASVLQLRGDDDVLIQYTSGTTGLPKGATFTHDAILSHAANVALEYAIDGSSRLLISLPHNAGTNIQTVPALYLGATVLFTDVRSFDAEEWVGKVNRLGATHTQVVPTILYRVLEVCRHKETSMPTMRRLGYGSAPIPPDRVRELLDVFGNVFIQLYGMIEIAAMGTMLRPDEHVWALAEAPEVLGSVGQPAYSMDVRVVDKQGRDVAAGERGEVVFKGPHMMRNYWNAPDITAETIKDGWLHSGDVGVYRDGYLYLVDRIKDLIIRGGQNIASKEVEEAIYTHPAVLEVAVIGVPEPEWGEEIVAAVVLRPGALAEPDEILRACADHGLTRFKTPTQVHFIEELPRNAVGKIQKGVLRDRYRDAPQS